MNPTIQKAVIRASLFDNNFSKTSTFCSADKSFNSTYTSKFYYCLLLSFSILVSFIAYLMNFNKTLMIKYSKNATIKNALIVKKLFLVQIPDKNLFIKMPVMLPMIIIGHDTIALRIFTIGSLD